MSWRGSGAVYEQQSIGSERRSDILKLILYDLNSAIAPQDNRIVALQTAISEFDHDQDYKHDEELDLHADKILFQKLAFAFHVDRSSEEVAMICTALEMVYRASRPRLAQSFAELRESILPIFVEMLGKPVHLRKQEALEKAIAAQAQSFDDQGSRRASYSEYGSSRSASSSAFAKSHDRRTEKETGVHPYQRFKNDSQQEGSFSSYDEHSSRKVTKNLDDDQSYRSYDEKSFTKQAKKLDDEQSYNSYDDQSLSKPLKKFDDDQSYRSYDDQSFSKPSKKFDDDNSYYSSEQQSYTKPQKKFDDEQSFRSYDGQSFTKPSKKFDDEQSYRSFSEQSFSEPTKKFDGEQSYRSYDDQSYSEPTTKIHDENSYRSSEQESFSKTSKKVEDEQSYRSYDDQSFNPPNASDQQSFSEPNKKFNEEKSYNSENERTLSESSKKFDDSQSYRSFSSRNFSKTSNNVGDGDQSYRSHGGISSSNQTENTENDEVNRSFDEKQASSVLNDDSYSLLSQEERRSSNQRDSVPGDRTYNNEEDHRISNPAQNDDSEDNQSFYTDGDGINASGRSRDSDAHQSVLNYNEQSLSKVTESIQEDTTYQSVDESNVQDSIHQRIDHESYQDTNDAKFNTFHYMDNSTPHGSQSSSISFAIANQREGSVSDYQHSNHSKSAEENKSTFQSDDIYSKSDASTLPDYEQYKTVQKTEGDEFSIREQNINNEESQDRSYQDDQPDDAGNQYGRRDHQSENQTYTSDSESVFPDDGTYDQSRLSKDGSKSRPASDYDEQSYMSYTHEVNGHDSELSREREGFQQEDQNRGFKNQNFNKSQSLFPKSNKDKNPSVDEEHVDYEIRDAASKSDLDGDKSVSQDTYFTEEGYYSEEQSLQPTMYTRDNGQFEDQHNRARGSSRMDPSHSQDPEDEGYSRNSSYGGSFSNKGYDRSTEKSDDDESLYSEVLNKPAKATYDVETVYSQEDNDEASFDSSPNLKQSMSYDGNNVDKSDIRGYPTSRSAKNLSPVPEEQDEKSSSIMSHRVSMPPSLHSRLPPIEEYATSRSSRSETSSRSARTIKERKLENERRMSEQVARLEAELEIIRVEDATNAVGVSRTLQVLRYFSRILSAMVPMAHHPGLLDALVYQLERQPYGRHATHFHEHDDGEPRAEIDKEELEASRVDAIATIVNLACAEENKVKIASHPGLLDAITTVAQMDPSDEAREHAAIVLMNLAYEDENKELMVEHEQMLDTLVQLIQDASPFTRRYASAAMFTLACVVGNSEKMSVYCDGEILECLRRVLANDPVDEARINSAEALFNMARNNTEETLEVMGEHPRLLATIAKAVLTDYSADVRVFCARALEWMAVGIHYPMNCHRLLLSALTVSAQWTKTSCIAEAIKTQATLAENRLPMAGHDGLLQSLANLALLESSTDLEVRKSAIAALEMISRAAKARQYMVQNELVMKAITKASFDHNDVVYGEDGDGEEVTTLLLKQAMKNLALEM